MKFLRHDGTPFEVADSELCANCNRPASNHGTTLKDYQEVPVSYSYERVYESKADPHYVVRRRTSVDKVGHLSYDEQYCPGFTLKG
jgi:hypothetical protein